MSTSNKTYWAAEPEPKKLIERALERFSWHISDMRRTGRLQRSQRGVSAYYGFGTDGFRDASAQADLDDGAIVETHVNKIRPAVQNALSIICGTRPALKPRAKNGDAVNAAQTRMAAALLETYERKQGTKQLQYQQARGGLVASSWWSVDSWRPNDGAEVAVDPESGFVVYEGDLETVLIPPWRVAADATPTEPEQRRWVLFKRRERIHDLIQVASEKGNTELVEKLMGQVGTPSASMSAGILGGKIMATLAGLDEATGDSLRPDDEAWVWELRHLPSPALRTGRLVRFIEPDIALFDSMLVGDEGPAQYPYFGLHAQEFCPERMLGSTHGHTPAFDLQGLQEFYDTCTTSMGTTVNLMGLPHLHSPPNSVPTPHQLGNGITVLESALPPAAIDFPALKPEVVAAADWASSQINLTLALNDTVMGNPPKGMPASAQALQRAQAVQFNQGPQEAWVKLIGDSATSRLQILKRFARTERVTSLAGAGGVWESMAWSSKDIADMEGFDVEEVDPISGSFEGRQAMAELLGIDGESLYDFLTTGSLPLAMKDKKAAHEYAEKVGHDLERGIGLAPVDMLASQQAGEAVFLDDGQKHVTLSRMDPLHLVLAKASAVFRAAKTTGQVDVMQVAGDVCARAFELWSQLTPDELVAYGIPPLPSQQGMAAGPVQVQDEETGEVVGEAPGEMGDTGLPEENPSLPAPPQNPITGDSEDASQLNLGA